MNKALPHISVCICTYKRPELLTRTLSSISAQESGQRFTWSVVVADNDKAESARAVVAEVAASCTVPVVYCSEPRQNIAMARNRAIENASGEFVAFIDDDEFVSSDWLQTLLGALETFDADAVLGPVDPFFDADAPRWVVQGRFYNRAVLASGTFLSWKQCRTGNVLLKRTLFAGDRQPFDPACLSGEDQDFFRRKSESGHKFVWCHEARALEVVPPVRWKRSFLLRRALFRGIFAQRNHGLQPIRLLQALISVPLYAAALPFALVLGQARFMICAFKLSYHTGRLLGFLKINPIRQAYVVD